MEPLLNFTSLLIALISLVVSVIALIISQKVYIHSSKDFIPEIDYKVTEDNSINFVHKSHKIFQIDSVALLRIDTFGFEDIANKTVTQIPFITRSLVHPWIEKGGKAKYFSVPSNASGACAHICAYDTDLIKKTSDRINMLYSPVNFERSSRALPSLQNIFYLFEINYSNKFHDRKTLLLKYQHIHGWGFSKFKISEEEFINTLNHSNIPPFEDFEQLWEHLVNTYKKPFSDFF